MSKKKKRESINPIKLLKIKCRKCNRRYATRFFLGKPYCAKCDVGKKKLQHGGPKCLKNL